MNGFIDIHTHILPGVDDGAKDLSNALALLRCAYENGTRGIVLTPHYRGMYKANPVQLLQDQFAALCQAAAHALPELTLYLGQEIYFGTGSTQALLDSRALTMADSDYVLLEFAPNSTAEQMLRSVEDLRYYGYRPIIAHGERYAALRRSRKLLHRLLELGATLQLNADSILGRHGLFVSQFCRYALKKKLVSFIGSDAHDMRSRPPLLRDCYLHICKSYGQDYAHRLFSANALAVIQNEKF